jgi:hypothetical protein
VFDHSTKIHKGWGADALTVRKTLKGSPLRSTGVRTMGVRTGGGVGLGRCAYRWRGGLWVE